MKINKLHRFIEAQSILVLYYAKRNFNFSKYEMYERLHK